MTPRTRSVLQNAALCLISTIVALLLCEGGLRVYAAWYPAASPLAGFRFLDNPVGEHAALADQYVADSSVATGIDRRWFDESPTTQPKRVQDVDATDMAKLEEYIRDGHFGPHSFYIWNENFLNS